VPQEEVIQTMVEYKIILPDLTAHLIITIAVQDHIAQVLAEDLVAVAEEEEDLLAVAVAEVVEDNISITKARKNKCCTIVT
jgi:hypothetical protein